MTDMLPAQLSLQVDDPDAADDRPAPAPALGTVAISDRLAVPRDLYRGDEVRILVSDANGELLATGLANVSRIAFDEHDDKTGTWTERAHRVRLQ